MKTSIQLIAETGQLERVSETANLLLMLRDRSDDNFEVALQIAPRWLVDAFAPERTVEESEAWLLRWQSAPDPLAFERESGWTASNWIHWFSSDNEFWVISDARIDESGHHLTLYLEHDDDPIPFEALRWLAQVAGLRVGNAVRLE